MHFLARWARRCVELRQPRLSPPQGMNELVAPMFYVLCNSRSEGDNEALPAAESDGGATARVDAEAGGEDRDGGGDGD